MFIADNFHQYKNLFIEKLNSILDDDELGAFILVLANSRQDDFLRQQLAGDLNNAFNNLKEKFSAGQLTTTSDDSDVFRQLLDIDVDDIPLWKNKRIGHWQVFYNAMRQLRPARASGQILSSIKQPFNSSKFHFNKPFLAPEILWQGDYQGVALKVLFNKFPFADYHLILAVSPELALPQQLTAKSHQLIFTLAEEYSDLFSGFGIGFNSIAAGASVNHLHFQAFIREERFPVEDPCWRHNGGNDDYPVSVKKYNEEETAWKFIEQLTEQDIAFNCLYRKQACYIFPRKFQGSTELPDWLQGAGWLDLSGVMTASETSTYDSLDAQSVSIALRQLEIPIS